MGRNRDFIPLQRKICTKRHFAFKKNLGDMKKTPEQEKKIIFNIQK